MASRTDAVDQWYADRHKRLGNAPLWPQRMVMESLPNDWIRGSPTGTQRHFELPTTAKLNTNVMKPFGPCVDDRGKNLQGTQQRSDDTSLVLKKLKPGSANFVEANRRRTRPIGKASIGQTALQIGTFDNYRFSKQTSWRTDVQRVFERILFRTASGLMTKNLAGRLGSKGALSCTPTSTPTGRVTEDHENGSLRNRE